MDIDPYYLRNTITDEYYNVFEFRLRAEPTVSGLPAIAPSDPIFVVMAPEGMQYHHTSLMLSEHLAMNGFSVVPEPATGVLAVAGIATVLIVHGRRKRN